LYLGINIICHGVLLDASHVGIVLLAFWNTLRLLLQTNVLEGAIAEAP
jgi:hypothetical protein